MLARRAAAVAGGVRHAASLAGAAARGGAGGAGGGAAGGRGAGAAARSGAASGGARRRDPDDGDAASPAATSPMRMSGKVRSRLRMKEEGKPRVRAHMLRMRARVFRAILCDSARFREGKKSRIAESADVCSGGAGDAACRRHWHGRRRCGARVRTRRGRAKGREGALHPNERFRAPNCDRHRRWGAGTRAGDQGGPQGRGQGRRR